MMTVRFDPGQKYLLIMNYIECISHMHTIGSE